MENIFATLPLDSSWVPDDDEDKALALSLYPHINCPDDRAWSPGLQLAYWVY